jgi:uncharacterized membrane protein YfcA
MEYAVVALVAFAASGLTLVSGFGLGTLLLPAFLLFFPPDLAVAMTGIVHFLNTLFKLLLVGRDADRGIVVRFGLTAIPGAFAGAALLVYTSGLPPIASYELGGRLHHVLPVNLLMAVLIAGFGIMEMLPSARKGRFGRGAIPVGGLLSGFFGGLSGHQGALRSAFLIRAGLTKEAFIGTGVVLACLVDLTRLSVYARHLEATGIGERSVLLAVAAVAAFAGAYSGKRFIRTMTLRSVQIVVSVFLLVIAIGLGTGLI